MRPRWPEWVIVLSIVALSGAGVWALWGDDIRRLFKPGEEQKPDVQSEPQVTPPAGPAAGPF